MKLTPMRHRVVFSPLELQVEDVTGPDGQRIRAQVDPATGMLMAGEVIHCPVAIVIGVGRDVDEVRVGQRIIAPRHLRELVERLDTPHGSIPVESVSMRRRCSMCGQGMPSRELVAVCEGETYRAPRGRVVCRVEEVEPGAFGVAEDAAMTWGRVESSGVDGVWQGDRVGWKTGTGTWWSHDGQGWASIRGDVRCSSCGWVWRGGLEARDASAGTERCPWGEA